MSWMLDRERGAVRNYHTVLYPDQIEAVRRLAEQDRISHSRALRAVVDAGLEALGIEHRKGPTDG